MILQKITEQGLNGGNFKGRRDARATRVGAVGRALRYLLEEARTRACSDLRSL
jgi:hypothetical protein